jgi:putative addiction module killer protein
LEARSRALRDYQTAEGKFPFRDWLEQYDGQKVFGVINARLRRVENGNFGDCEPVGEGVSELKIDFGPGFRVYFGIDGDIIVLLHGGTKGSQKANIKTAQKYWREYNA